MNGGVVIRLSYGTDKLFRGNGVCYDTVTAAVTDAWVEMGLQNANTQSRIEETGRRKTQSTGNAVMAGICSDVKFM
jgi:hypothetical protein